MQEAFGVFETLAVVLLVAAAIGSLFVKMKQPLVVAFILAGILIGPSAFALVGEGPALDVVHALSEIGIVVLLFTVGLKLDMGDIKSSGATSAIVGVGKMLAVAVVGFGVTMALGFELMSALYVSLAMAFSSTIIVIKTLADRQELESLHGNIAVGALIIEDIAVILTMIVVTSLGAANAAAGGVGLELLKTLVLGVVFIGVVLLVAKRLLPGLLKNIARSGELLVLFAIAWAIVLSATGDYLGFSKEIGAFIAGFALASSPLRDRIKLRITPLQDFFLLFFFLDLGMKMNLSASFAQLPTALLLSFIVAVGGPIVVLFIMGRLGYRRQTAFYTGLSLAQISEFSIILVALGISFGHVPEEILGLVTMMALITIAQATYTMRYASRLYRLLKAPIKVFQAKVPYREDSDEEGRTPSEFVVIGYGRYGGLIADGLIAEGRHVLGVDFDPRVIKRPSTEFLHFTYGDADDPDLGNHLPLDTAQWVISTIPRLETNLELLGNLRALGYEGKVAAALNDEDGVEELKSAGVDLVLLPFADAADQAVDLLSGRAVRTSCSAVACYLGER